MPRSGRASRPNRNPVAISAPELCPSRHKFSRACNASDSRSAAMASARSSRGSGQWPRIIERTRDALISPVDPRLSSTARQRVPRSSPPGCGSPRNRARTADMNPQRRSSPEGVSPVPRPTSEDTDDRMPANPTRESGQKPGSPAHASARAEAPSASAACRRVSPSFATGRPGSRSASSLRSNCFLAWTSASRVAHVWQTFVNRTIGGKERGRPRRAQFRSTATVIPWPSIRIKPSASRAELPVVSRQVLKSAGRPRTTAWG